MGNKVKYIDIKRRTYYFFDDINFDPNNMKTYEKLFLFTTLDMCQSTI